MTKAKPRAGAWIVAAALLGTAGFAGGCNRAHLSSYYGRSFAAWFGAQHVRDEPADSEATKRALGNLDAQEAAAISKNYRKTSGDQGGQGQMVMIGQAHGNEAYVPPPSVPGGQ